MYESQLTREISRLKSSNQNPTSQQTTITSRQARTKRRKTYEHITSASSSHHPTIHSNFTYRTQNVIQQIHTAGLNFLNARLDGNSSNIIGIVYTKTVML
jgi:hypothetical protein